MNLIPELTMNVIMPSQSVSGQSILCSKPNFESESGTGREREREIWMMMKRRMFITRLVATLNTLIK